MRPVAPEDGTDTVPATRSWRWVTVTLLVVAVALLVTSGVLLARGPLAGDVDDRTLEVSQRHETAAEAARAQAVAFLTVDHQDMDTVVDRVLSGATGRFRDEYERDRDRLASRTRASRAVATAEAVAVGVSRLSGARAVVLVAADQEVRNASTGGRPRVRPYRLELTLEREGGSWLTSGLRVVG